MGRVVAVLILTAAMSSAVARDANIYDLFQIKQGNVSSNERWAGKILLTGDVLIPEGVTVDLQPGTWIIYNEMDLANLGNDSQVPELIVLGNLHVAPGGDSIKTFFLGAPEVQAFIAANTKLDAQDINVEPVRTDVFTNEWRDYKRRYAVLWAMLYSLWLIF